MLKIFPLTMILITVENVSVLISFLCIKDTRITITSTQSQPKNRFSSKEQIKSYIRARAAQTLN